MKFFKPAIRNKINEEEFEALSSNRLITKSSTAFTSGSFTTFLHLSKKQHTHRERERRGRDAYQATNKTIKSFNSIFVHHWEGRQTISPKDHYQIYFQMKFCILVVIFRNQFRDLVRRVKT